MPVTFLKLLGYNSVPVNVAATALSAGNAVDPAEIALALDNTGSMRGQMPALITAATNLVNTVMPIGSTNVKVSVVPYAAAVNPGAHKFNSNMIDHAARSIWHGVHFREQWAAVQSGCANPWGGGGGGGGSGGSSSGDRSDAGPALDIFKSLRRFAGEMFGISQARADVTPNTVAPLTTVIQNGYPVPDGFEIVPPASSGTPCYFLANQGTISHSDLFKRIGPTGVAWKGCVEARPTRLDISTNGGSPVVDYDVTDIPPGVDPNSQFVPYFWPYESDTYNDSNVTTPGPYPQASGKPSYHNNYLADGAPPTGWSYNYAEGTSDDYLRSETLFKYDRLTPPGIIKETAPDTYGPNANCPDELQRLTSNRSEVMAKISSMNYWLGGGTIISEGLMWAWRTLSPNAPYQDGAPYGGKTKKYIVLMTDGVNGLADNNSTGYSPVSDYSSYGYLVHGRALNPPERDPSTWATFAQVTEFLDARTTLACANAKAAGIKIYSVFFNNGLSTASAARAQALLQTCASDSASYFLATDSTTLNAAFAKVAGSIGAGTGALRLVK